MGGNNRDDHPRDVCLTAQVGQGSTPRRVAQIAFLDDLCASSTAMPRDTI